MIFSQNVDLHGADTMEALSRLKSHLDYMQERLELFERSNRRKLAALEERIKVLEGKVT